MTSPPPPQYPGPPYPQQQFAPPRPAPRSAGHVLNVTASVILLVLGALVLVPLAFIGLMMGKSESCYTGCGTGLVSIGQMIALFGPLAVFVVTLVATIRLIDRRRHAWWMPIVGIVGSIVILLIGNAIASAGL